jgi:hypothetical protein
VRPKKKEEKGDMVNYWVAMYDVPFSCPILTAGGDSITRLWPMPQPWDDSTEAINHWLEVATGLTLDRAHGVIIAMDAPAWQQRRIELAPDQN